METQRFKISVSNKRFDTKEGAINGIKTSIFRKMDATVDDLAQYLLNGHAVTSEYKEDLFAQNGRKGMEAVSCQMFAFDVDGKDNKTDEIYWDHGLKETIDMLTVKPSFCYTTYDHNPSVHNNRFRLIYILDKPIKSSLEYRKVSKTFAENLGLNVVGKALDSASFSMNRNWFGTKPGAESYRSDTVVKTKPLYADWDNKFRVKKTSGKTEKNSHIPDSIWNSDYVQEFLHEKTIYRYYQNHVGTKNKMVSDNEKYCPEDEVWYYFGDNDYALNPRRKNAISLKTGKHIRKIDRYRDGNQDKRRRAMLFCFGIIYMDITPNLTFKELLYDLCYCLVNYIDNREDEITKEELLGIAWDAYTDDREDYNDYDKDFGRIRKYKTRKVNINYCIKNNRSTKSVAAENGGIERGLKTYEFVKEHYDPELKIRENVEKFNELGHPMSEATLKRYLKKMKDEKIPLRSPRVKHVTYIDDILYSINSEEEEKIILHANDTFLNHIQIEIENEGKKAEKVPMKLKKATEEDLKILPEGCRFIDGNLVYPIHLEREVKRLGYC